MVAGITGTDRFTSFGEPGWHRLGKTLPKDHPARRNVPLALEISGLDTWTVDLMPMVVASAGTEYTQGGSKYAVPAKYAGLEVPEKFAVVRSDNKDVLGVVGNLYTPMQNREHFEWFQDWIDDGAAAIETCGSLWGGRQIFVMAEAENDTLEIIKDSSKPDTVTPFILISSSHDGSLATVAGFTPIRVVCWNTLSMARRDKRSQLVKIKHTKGQTHALAEIRKTMDIARGQFRATAEQFQRLARCPINQKNLVDYVRLVFDKPTVEQEQAGKLKPLAPKTLNQFDRIAELVKNGAGADMAGMTLWGAYNAVTAFLSHESGHSVETRQSSLWFGQGFKRLDKALAIAIHLAG